MKILVIGGSGMLGHKLIDSWKDKFDVWTTLRGNSGNYESIKILDNKKIFFQTDVENVCRLENIIEKVKPNVIVNAVGVIKQLELSKNVIKTLTINAIFPHQLALIAGNVGARLISFSTDCVFNGEKGNYSETDKPDADDLYGKSKNLGEVTGENCLTIRTSIIGRELNNSHSLVEWFLKQRGEKIRGFKNAFFTGFPTIIIADIVADLISNQKKMNGLYHVSSNKISKFDLLQLLKNKYQIKVEIEPFEEFKIDRSLDSTKFKTETGFEPLSWDEMISKMVSDPFPYDAMRK